MVRSDFDRRREQFDRDFADMEKRVKLGMKVAAAVGITAVVTVLIVAVWTVVKLVSHFTS